MDFDAINPALCTLASRLTGIDAACCVFEDAPRPRSNNALVILSWVTPGAPVGMDSTQWDFAADPDPLLEMTPTTGGPRTASLQFAVESLADWRVADRAVNRARTLFRSPYALAALVAVGLALATVGATTKANYSDQNRMVSRSLFEVTFNAVDTQVDADSVTSYIATATIEGALITPDGVPLPATIQPTVT